MPKCPKCHKNIKYLKAYEKVEAMSWLDKTGYHAMDYTLEGNGFDSFECPLCTEELFTEETKAEKFMKCENPERD